MPASCHGATIGTAGEFWNFRSSFTPKPMAWDRSGLSISAPPPWRTARTSREPAAETGWSTSFGPGMPVLDGSPPEILAGGSPSSSRSPGSNRVALPQRGRSRQASSVIATVLVTQSQGRATSMLRAEIDHAVGGIGRGAGHARGEVGPLRHLGRVAALAEAEDRHGGGDAAPPRPFGRHHHHHRAFGDETPGIAAQRLDHPWARRHWPRASAAGEAAARGWTRPGGDRHRDRGALPGGSAVLVHVASRDHRIAATTPNRPDGGR